MKQHIPDTRLVSYVMICVIIDIILLLIFTSIEPDTVSHSNGSIKSLNALHDIQYQYPVCSESDTIDVVFYC